MKYRVTTALKNFDGEKFTDEKGEDLTVRQLCVSVLLNYSGDAFDSFSKYDRCKLAEVIHKKADVELDSAQVTALKTAIDEMYPINVIGPVWDFFEKRN